MKFVEESDERTILLVDWDEQRAIHGSLRESIEVIEECLFETRMGRSVTDAQGTMTEFDPVHRRWGRRKRVSVGEKELVMIREALETAREIDDCEFGTRMGLTKEEVRGVLAEVSALVGQ